VVTGHVNYVSAAQPDGEEGPMVVSIECTPPAEATDDDELLQVLIHSKKVGTSLSQLLA
jgi:hypothetical protein